MLAQKSKQLVIILMIISLIACQSNEDILMTPRIENIKISKVVSSSLELDLLWQIEFEEPFTYYSPIRTEEMVVIPTETTVHGVDLKTGTETWSYQINTRDNTYPISGNNEYVVFANSNDRIIYCLEIATGEVKWKHELFERAISIDVAEQAVYISTQPTFIVSLDIETGEILWVIDGIENGIDARGVTLNYTYDRLRISSSTTHLANPNTGEIFKVISEIKDPFVMHEAGYWTDTTVYDPMTFEVQHRFIPNKNCSAGIHRFYKTVAYRIDSCGLTAISTETYERLWFYFDDALINGIGIYGGLFYIWLENGQLHAFNYQTGEEIGQLITDGTAPYNNAGLYTANKVLLIAVDNHRMWAFSTG